MTDSKRDEMLMDINGKLERLLGVVVGENGGGMVARLASVEEKQEQCVTHRELATYGGIVVAVAGAFSWLMSKLGGRV
jgi:hypothetical protein